MISFLKNLLIECMSALSAYTPHMSEGGGHQIPLQLVMSHMWLLGTEIRTSVRAEPLNLQAIAPAPCFHSV